MEKIEYFVELKIKAVVDFCWCEWMDGCWRGVGGREITWYGVLWWMEFFLERGRDGVLVVVFDGRVWSRDDFWLLVLLPLLLRVGIVRIIILMTIIIRVHDISYTVRCWGR